MKTEIIYFSATGTTKSIVTAISKGLRGEVHFTDITLPEKRKDAIEIDCDLVIAAIPVYGERIPHFLYDYLKNIHGNGTYLAAISVYGNIGFGISLEQWKRLAETNHFRLIAAGAFIGQHTYASREAPVAYGRPDESDIREARTFAEDIQKKLDTGDSKCPEIPKCTLPGFITKLPDSGTRLLVRQPRINNRTACNNCGACVRKCPVGAINSETLEISENKCLRCYACVRVCPQKARTAGLRLSVFRTIFFHAGMSKKENQIFL
jgi:ferredoxin